MSLALVDADHRRVLPVPSSALQGHGLAPGPTGLLLARRNCSMALQARSQSNEGSQAEAGLEKRLPHDGALNCGHSAPLAFHAQPQYKPGHPSKHAELTTQPGCSPPAAGALTDADS